MRWREVNCPDLERGVGGILVSTWAEGRDPEDPEDPALNFGNPDMGAVRRDGLRPRDLAFLDGKASQEGRRKNVTVRVLP